jgi:hypothetical protein
MMDAIKRRSSRLDGGRDLVTGRTLAALTNDQLDDLIAAELPDPAAYLATSREERWCWLDDHKEGILRRPAPAPIGSARAPEISTVRHTRWRVQ